MVQFCKCGSLIIDGLCTNKNCTVKPAGASKTGKAEKQAKKTGKTAKSKRAPKSSNSGIPAAQENLLAD